MSPAERKEANGCSFVFTYSVSTCRRWVGGRQRCKNEHEGSIKRAKERKRKEKKTGPQRATVRTKALISLGAPAAGSSLLVLMLLGETGA